MSKIPSLLSGHSREKGIQTGRVSNTRTTYAPMESCNNCGYVIEQPTLQQSTGSKLPNTEEQSVEVIIVCNAPPVVYSPVCTHFESPCDHVLPYVEGSIFATATSDSDDNVEEFQYSLDRNRTPVLSVRYFFKITRKPLNYHRNDGLVVFQYSSWVMIFFYYQHYMVDLTVFNLRMDKRICLKI